MQPMFVFPFVRGPSVARIGQQRLEELNRHDRTAFKIDRRGGEHPHVFEALHMRQIALAERHKEADALHLGEAGRKRFDLLVMQQVHILFAHALKVVFALDGHRFGFHPTAVLPVGAVRGHLAQVDFGVKLVANG